MLSNVSFHLMKSKVNEFKLKCIVKRQDGVRKQLQIIDITPLLIVVEKMSPH